MQFKLTLFKCWLYFKATKINLWVAGSVATVLFAIQSNLSLYLTQLFYSNVPYLKSDNPSIFSEMQPLNELWATSCLRTFHVFEPLWLHVNQILPGSCPSSLLHFRDSLSQWHDYQLWWAGGEMKMVRHVMHELGNHQILDTSYVIAKQWKNNTFTEKVGNWQEKSYTVGPQIMLFLQRPFVITLMIKEIDSWLGPLYGVNTFSPGLCGISSRYSGFLPHRKDVPMTWIRKSTWSLSGTGRVYVGGPMLLK